jgi:hypothetical protein
MLQHFSAKDHVETIVRELELGHVTPHSPYRSDSNCGIVRSSAVTDVKYSVRNREKCPSRAPTSRTLDKFFGTIANRSCVLAISAGEFR